MIGQTIVGRYRVTGRVGGGSYAEVFRAQDLALNRLVALKAFYESSTPGILARIEREAAVWGGLTHARIVRLLDLFWDQSRLIFVLDFIDGWSLRALERGQPGGVLPLRRVLAIAQDLLSALTYLHGEGVVHRDIKPSNVLVRASDGAALLTDFNTVHAGQNTRLTLTGQAVGTPMYMSPEQLREAPTVPSSDLYAVGIVLYEALTGSVPHASDSRYELAMRRVQEPPPDPRGQDASMPTAVARLIVSLLATDPGARPTALAALEETRSILADLPLDAEVPRAPGPPPSGSGSQEPDLSATFPPAPPTRGRAEGEAVMATHLDLGADVRPTGFFASQRDRTEAFDQASRFFQRHLDEDYELLLSEARQAFQLWLGCVGSGFVIILIGVGLLIAGKIAAGGITVAADTFVLFIQRVFKQREDYYLSQAEAKQRHLRMGNVWQLAVQSAEGIGDPSLRANKLSELIDSLASQLRAPDGTGATPGSPNLRG